MAITREAGTERELDGDTGMTRNPPGQSRRFLRAKRDMYAPGGTVSCLNCAWAYSGARWAGKMWLNVYSR